MKEPIPVGGWFRVKVSPIHVRMGRMDARYDGAIGQVGQNPENAVPDVIVLHADPERGHDWLRYVELSAFHMAPDTPTEEEELRWSLCRLAGWEDSPDDWLPF